MKTYDHYDIHLYLRGRLKRRKSREIESLIGSDPSFKERVRFIKMDQYLSGLLPDQAARAFAGEISGDPVLQKKLLLHQTARKAIDLGMENDLKEQLRIWEDEWVDPKQGTRYNSLGFKPTIAIAAGMLMVLVLSIFLLRPSKGQQIFRNYYGPAADVISKSIEEENQAIGFSRPVYELDLLIEAMTNYNSKAYFAAISGYKSFLEAQSPWKNYAGYYLAQSYLAEERISEALPLLAELADNENFPEHPQAKLSLALAYIYQGDSDRATDLLEMLIDDPDYQKTVKEILGQMAD